MSGTGLQGCGCMASVGRVKGLMLVRASDSCLMLDYVCVINFHIIIIIIICLVPERLCCQISRHVFSMAAELCQNFIQ